MTRGMFVTVEGGEGVGKSTLIASLKSFFERQKLDVVSTREPGGTPLAEEIRTLFLSAEKKFDMSPLVETLLILAARADHVQKVIEPALLQGKMVFCDRFIDSTLAYQALAHHLPVASIYDMCLSAVPLLPDLTLCLTLTPEIAKKRRDVRRNAQSDRMEEKEIFFHRSINDAFLTISKMFPERIVLLDGSLSKNSLAEEAVSVVQKVLRDR